MTNEICSNCGKSSEIINYMGDENLYCKYDCMVEHLGYDPNDSESETPSETKSETPSEIIKKWNDNIKGFAPTYEGYLRMMYMDNDIVNETDEMKVFWCEAIDLFPNCYMKMYEVYINSK